MWRGASGLSGILLGPPQLLHHPSFPRDVGLSIQVSPLRKDTSPAGSGPTLMTSSELDHLQRLYFQEGPIHKSWGEDFDFFWRHTIRPITPPPRLAGGLNELRHEVPATETHPSTSVLVGIWLSPSWQGGCQCHGPPCGGTAVGTVQPRRVVNVKRDCGGDVDVPRRSPDLTSRINKRSRGSPHAQSPT